MWPSGTTAAGILPRRTGPRSSCSRAVIWRCASSHELPGGRRGALWARLIQARQQRHRAQTLIFVIPQVTGILAWNRRPVRSRHSQGLNARLPVIAARTVRRFYSVRAGARRSGRFGTDAPSLRRFRKHLPSRAHPTLGTLETALRNRLNPTDAYRMVQITIPKTVKHPHRPALIESVTRPVLYP